MLDQNGLSVFASRMSAFQNRLAEAGIDIALITDDDNVYYLTGYHDYLHMEFGRPTILAVTREGESLLITPAIDLNAAIASAHVDRIAAWNDGTGSEWREELPFVLKSTGKVALEPDHMPPLVRAYVGQLVDQTAISSITPILADMRMACRFVSSTSPPK